MKDYENMQKDFPELEGNVIDYYNEERTIKVVVVGCNYHIGITLKAFEHIPEDDVYYEVKKDDETFCSNGPLSPNKNMYLTNEDTYDRDFYACVKMIKRGHFDNYVSAAIANKKSYNEVLDNRGSSTVYCAYGA